MRSREVLIYLALKNNGNWDLIYEEILRKEVIDEKEVMKCLKSIGSRVVTLFDDDYPESLKTICKPPFVLFYHGDLSLIKDRKKMISVVGSREYSEYGLEATNKLVSEVAKELVVVSGMARGIDGIAHHACIDAGGKTVAVLGCGINVCYPPSNLDLYSEIGKHHLLISEYPKLTAPNPEKFPFRNRIVAGLSDCLLITEGKMNSGTSITATIALENGSAICCVPTRMGENSLCNHLIANGAALVETADDIYLEMDYRKKEVAFEK